MKQDKSIYLDAFGDYPLNRILNFFMIHEGFDYAMKDIARNSGVGYATMKLFWPHLVENKLVTQTRAIGNAKMFTLNLENPAVKAFKNFYWTVAEQLTIESHHHEHPEEFERVVQHKRITVPR